MAFPLKVHRITVQYQNETEAYELMLDPAAIQTLIVHWKDVQPVGLRHPDTASGIRRGELQPPLTSRMEFKKDIPKGELRPPLARRMEFASDMPTGLELRGVPGVAGIRRVDVRTISRETALRAPILCWHDPLCIWYCPDRGTDFIVTAIEFRYANLDGTWRTVLDPSWPDQIVFRNFTEPDPTYQPPDRNVHVIPAAELVVGERGVSEHEPLGYVASVAGEIAWHSPDCTWYNPE